jgi:hypothetical protein
MGRTYLYECPKCGYRARVSGGLDRGLSFHIQTVFCRECGVLYDSIVRAKVACGYAGSRVRQELQRAWASRSSAVSNFPEAPPPIESVLNRLPFRARQFTWVQFKPRCPVSALHRVDPWVDRGKCPKCGGHLEKGALPYRVWE